ncbi:Trp biosynthesis-associated membrane protein [Zhihengliuella flava]|uniref:Membrane protein (TIGR02234 family) n=1 Tax=Zhihengliuella flava TaxID=1285193 RepID=A0A931GJV1_9MICC|nr:Trp biosynthesis-associated membrane protein [Zhihengliuella flava]MBG6085731.1 putative membrane protein (TIGR02234 family) [Zhihengliuella flava]
MSRRTAVFAALAGALVALLAVTRTWIEVVPGPQAIIQAPVVVPGADAATSVSALAVVALAASVSLSIAGRITRYIIGALILLAGVGIAGASWGVMASPESAAATLVGEAAGTAQIDADYVVAVWPWVAMAAGVWVALAGLAVLVASRRWRVSRRYTTASATAGSASAEPSSEATEQPLDEIDGWDQLSRGDDPTR